MKSDHFDRFARMRPRCAKVAYAYDRFGRVTQDGELTYLYDGNGNRAEIGYPGGVTARYTHDFADREASLEVQLGSAAPQTLVSGAAYKPLGPLAGLNLGNGLTEARSFDARYFPERLEVPGRLLQTYTTDPVGNILGLTRTVGTGGHNPKLLRIEPAPGGEPGSRLELGYDAAGNQTAAAAVTGEGSGRTSFLDYSAESRLSRLATSNGPSSTELLYDGRGYLRRSRLTATNTSDFEQTEPVYNSEGLLLARRYHKQSTRGGRGDGGAPPTTRTVMETAYLFYFAGRPVAQLTRRQAGGGADTLLYLTTGLSGRADPGHGHDRSDPLGRRARSIWYTVRLPPRRSTAGRWRSRRLGCRIVKECLGHHGERGYFPSLPRAVE